MQMLGGKSEGAPQQQAQRPAQQQQQQRPAQQSQQTPPMAEPDFDFDDDIPFS